MINRFLIFLFGKNSKYALEPLGLLSGLTIVVLWAAWYIVSRYGVLGNLTPADITILRYSVGSLVTLPLIFWAFKREIPWKFLPLFIITYGFPYCVFLYIGLEETVAANAGVILNGLLPIVTACFAWIVFKRTIGKIKWIAIFVLALANLLMFYASFAEGSFNWGWLWIIASTVLLAVYLTTVRVKHVDMIVLLPTMSIGNLILFLPFWYYMPTNIENATWGEITLQAVFQGIINQIAVIWLISFTIKRIGSVSTTVLYGFVPALTAIMGWLLLNESLLAVEIFAIILCSVGIIVFSRSK